MRWRPKLLRVLSGTRPDSSQRAMSLCWSSAASSARIFGPSPAA